MCIVSPATGLLCEPGSPDSETQLEPVAENGQVPGPVRVGSVEELADDPQVELGRPSLQPGEFIL